MLKRKVRVLAAVLCSIMLVALFAGCGENTSGTVGASTADAKNKELVIVSAIEDATYDLHQSSYIGIEKSYLYPPLVSLNADKTGIVPNIAESANFSDDGKSITIKLPKGLTFSNGDPLNAAAVKASYERFLKLSPLASMASVITSIEAPDAQTVVINFSAPPGAFLATLSSGMFGVVDVAEAKKIGDSAFMSNPVGYGMAYVKEWNKGNYLILARNDKYKTNNPDIKNNGPINFETIKIRFIPNDFTAISELISGNVDILMSVPLESLDALRNNKDITVKEIPGNGLSYLQFNPARKLDVKVKSALELATDREALATAFKGNVKPAYGPYMSEWIGFSKEAEEKYKTERAYNLEKAKALLAEAGYKDTDGDGIVEKDGKPLSLDIILANSNALNKTLGPVLQSQYKELGVKLNLKQLDQAGLVAVSKSGDYDMFSGGVGWADASVMSYVANGNGLMVGNPDKEKFEKAMNDAANTIDIPKRIALYEEAGRMLMGTHAIIPLYEAKQYIAFRNNIKGITDDVTLNDITKQ